MTPTHILIALKSGSREKGAFTVKYEIDLERNWHVRASLCSYQARARSTSNASMAKNGQNRGEPQKMTPSSETEIFFGVVPMGKLEPRV